MCSFFKCTFLDIIKLFLEFTTIILCTQFMPYPAITSDHIQVSGNFERTTGSAEDFDPVHPAASSGPGGPGKPMVISPPLSRE